MKNFKKKEIKPKEENFNRCLNYVFFLLNRREYSYKEIQDKLHQYLYHENDIKKVLDYIVENKYQSDERMAINFVRNKKHHYGKLKIKQQLLQKGISADLIEQAIEDAYLEEDNIYSHNLNNNLNQDSNEHAFVLEEQTFNYAENVLLKKFKKIDDMKKDKERWFKKDKPKIIRFMMSRGFTFKEFSHLI